METLQPKRNWNEAKGRLKEQYGFLTDADLDFSEGQGEEFLSHLESKLQIPKHALRDYIELV